MNHKPSVLVADGTDACSYISIVPNRMGFTAIPVQSWRDALDLARSIHPDVAIINENLPGENGFSVLREIRSVSFISDTRVIMMSNGTIDEMRDRSKWLECDAYLSKPINIIKLHGETRQRVSFPGGKKRRHVRAAWSKKIPLDYSGHTHQYDTVSISEGGMYVRSVDHVARGTKVSGTLPVDDLALIDFNDFVIYTRGVSKEFPEVIPGMGIAFKSLSGNNSHSLRSHIVKLLTLGVSGIDDHIIFT